MSCKLMNKNIKCTNLFISLEQQYYTQADYAPNIEGDAQQTKKTKNHTL